jgi:NitT/TauT family transport system substrate-binding protein
VRFMDTNAFYPFQQISVIFYSDKFATQRRDVADKFMRAWLRGVRTYNDAIKDGKLAGPGADEVVGTIAKSFNMNPTLVREMYSQAVSVDGNVNAAGIQKDLDFFIKQGWVTGQVKASDVIDMSWAKKASAKLGAYQRKQQ